MSAHFIDGENCMGQQETYWREFLQSTDGSMVVGLGRTKEEAENCAALNLIEHERVLHLPDKERLKVLLAGDERYGISLRDYEEILRLIGKILLNT